MTRLKMELPRLGSRKRIGCEDAIRCFFDLKAAELEIYRDLHRNGPATAQEIGRRIGKDRSTAYRGVTHLVKNGLVKKGVKKQKSGGIYHTYLAVEPEKVQDILMDRIDDWYQTLKKAAERASVELGAKR